MFSPVRLLIEKLYLASDKAFKKASCRYICSLQGFKFGELGGHCFVWVICKTVRLRALLSDACYVYRAPCISLNLNLRPAAVGCSVQ